MSFTSIYFTLWAKLEARALHSHQLENLLYLEDISRICDEYSGSASTVCIQFVYTDSPSMWMLVHRGCILSKT